MTVLAGGREACALMIGIIGVVVIFLVAEEALRGRAVILPVYVTLRTAGTDVRAGEREIGLIMIERCGRPRIGGVTDRAVVIELSLNVVGVVDLLVILLMTRPAIGRRAFVLAADVTGDTAHRNVRSGEREIRTGMIEGGRFPRGRSMTVRAVMTELILHVIGIVHLLVISLMARPAIRGGSFKDPAHVTGDTTHRYMRSGEREVRSGVIEGGRFPSCRTVTVRAVVTELILHVIRVVHVLVILLMARPAIRGGSFKDAADMAT